MMSWPGVPRSVATIARPHASFSAAGSYRPVAAGTALNGRGLPVRDAVSTMRPPGILEGSIGDCCPSGTPSAQVRRESVRAIGPQVSDGSWIRL